MGGKGRHRPRIAQDPVEIAVRELAGRQSGNVARRQLLGLGLSVDAIKARVGNGSFVVRYRGVFCLAPARLDAQALIHAAVLAGGPDAVASHASAAWLWGFLAHYEPPPEIAFPKGDRRPRHILTHRCPSLQPRDITRQRGVPTTTRARTALDLAPRLTHKQLTRLVNDERREGRIRLDALRDVLDRNPLHAGTKLLRPLAATTTNPTRSSFEDDFLAFCRDHSLPTPLVNLKIHGREVDAYFPDHQLIVEVDGWEFHNDQDAFRDDRERDTENLRHGLATVRITEDRITNTPEHEAQRLREIMAR